MSPWQSRGRWFIRVNGRNGVPSWPTRELCEAAIAERQARAPAESTPMPFLEGRDLLEALLLQLPHLITRAQVDAYLADHRTRSVRAKLRAYPELHDQAVAAIAGAIAWAIEDPTDQGEPPP